MAQLSSILGGKTGGWAGSFEHACPACGLAAVIKARADPNFCIECMPNAIPMIVVDKNTTSQDLIDKIERRKENAKAGKDTFRTLPLTFSDDTGRK